ncbi:MFS transporter [Bacillus litorisediminis]|uniref:MFS transporter n=1 Tax=Bacillus litorisediminis TaxID=2922713 RepID=UPI001FAE390B|nr:MFS transporter [Bacillus litorisediminis]
MNQEKPRLWTKDFIIVSSVNFFLYLIFYLLMVTVALYAVEKYHASESQAGLVTGIFIIGTLIGRLFIGRIIDQMGYKKFLYIGLAFFTLTSFLYFFKLGITFLLINRFVHGIALGVASTATGSIVARIIPAARKGEGIGFYSLSVTLATAIGPFIGLFMSQHTSYQMIFSFCLILGIISLLIGIFLYIPAAEARSSASELKGFKLSGFIEPKAVPISIVAMILGFCYSSVLSFINFYAIELELIEAASFFFIVYAAAIIVSRPFTGRLMDVKGANYVMYPAFVLFGGGLLILSTAEVSLTFLLAGILIGLGFGNMQSVTQAIAIKLTPSHRMGLATSTFFILIDAGYGFGPYLLGFVIPLAGYNLLYAILGVTVLATAILYFFLHGQKETSARAIHNGIS